MKFIDAGKADMAEMLKTLTARRSPDREPEVVRAVADIVEDVRKKGDRALFDYAKKLDGAELDASTVKVSPEEMEKAVSSVPPELMKSLKRAAGRIRAYHERQLEVSPVKSFEYADEIGMKLGMRVSPLERVGVYVPGGKAAYASSVLMGAIPARVAGVAEIIMVSPQRGGEFHPHLAAAAKPAGVDRIFRVGGAQAIAAMAFGTESIPKVNKIVGPGNAYVAAAKRLVYGVVDIDMVAGPSEILVIGDGTSDPAFIAADLLSQAEHDETARPMLVSTSEREVNAVIEEVKSQLRGLERNEIAKKSVNNNGFAVLVEDLEQAAYIADAIAPEHLEIMCDNAREVADRIKYAGAIFIGPMTPEPVGDYIAGPNHILPTGGSAIYRGPLGVFDFFRRSSVMEASREAFTALADDTVRLAQSEGLKAHARSVTIRISKEKPENDR